MIDLELTHSLDLCLHGIKTGQAFTSIDTLIQSLAQYRDLAKAEGSIDTFKNICQSHALHQILLEDPYTHRVFHKPRGYAGDAVMLDFMYSGQFPEGTSNIGQEVFRATTRSPNGLSVVWRRDFCAQKIDEVANLNPNAQVVSIACGHLREAEKSKAVESGKLGGFIAFDQDIESLAVVEAQQGTQGIKTVHGSVTQVITGKLTFPESNFTYSAGLYDYLSNRIARILTARLFSMLAPKGKLLIANFTPDSHGRGYMEGLMDWNLIYRDERDLELLIDEIDSNSSFTKEVFRDPYQNVVYLELQKK